MAAVGTSADTLNNASRKRLFIISLHRRWSPASMDAVYYGRDQPLLNGGDSRLKE
jgi:hypothetical protein